MKRKLQIFVSSTYIDLKEERQAAVEAILNAGHIPAGMELFAAGNKSQLEVIKKWIDESDIYFLILGGRYGSIEENSKKSYTHLEFEYALSINKPFFSLVASQKAINNKVAVLGYKDAVELMHPEKYSHFKSEVTKNITVAFFDDNKDLKIEVLKSINFLISENKFTGWVSSKELQDLNKVLEENAKLKFEIEQLKYAQNALSTESTPSISYDNPSHGFSKQIPKTNPSVTTIHIVDKFDLPLNSAKVFLIAKNNIYHQAKESSSGVYELSLPKNDVSYSVFVAHPNQYAFFLDEYTPIEDLSVKLKEKKFGGSIVCPDGTGYIPGLEGRLAPILDNLNRTYLYADNISINDGEIQPVDFELGQELHLEDIYGIQMSIFFKRVKGKTALLDFEQPWQQAIRPF